MGDMGIMRVSFIIPTRNRREALLNCLESVDKQRYSATELIVVDDASDDGTESAVRERFPQAVVVRLEERRGQGPALVTGAALATGDIWINLDDDGYLASDDSIERAAAYFADDDDLGAVCFKVVAPDGSVRHREIPLRSKRLPTADTDIGYFLGGAVAFRARALIAAGGYPQDVEYFSWEHDVAFRMFKAGYRMLFAPEIRFVHLAIPSPHNSIDREAGYASIEMRLAARYLPTPYAQVHAGLWAGKSLAQSAMRGSVGSTVRAVRDATASWRTIRADSSRRLTMPETRRLSRLSGRTWY